MDSHCLLYIQLEIRKVLFSIRIFFLYSSGFNHFVNNKKRLKNMFSYSHKKKNTYAYSTALVDHLPIPMGNSTMDDVERHDIRHFQHMDFGQHMDCGSVG